MRALRLYLDNCCLNRPFDDPTQDRIRLEVEAIATIVEKIKRREWIWVVSAFLDAERAECPDETKKELVSKMFELPFDRVELFEEDVRRAHALRALGFKDYDALHIAAAERGMCNVLLTTDDRLIAKSRRLSKTLSVRVVNPVDWLLETLS